MISKKKCTACGACSNICPHKAIDMIQERDGFFYPIIDTQKCTECKLCDKVCPVNLPVTHSKCEKSFAAVIKDDDIRIKSSSGGIFSAIAEDIISNGGVVFGAGFDDDFIVRHICASDLVTLSNLRGSKYVQSDIGESFRNVKNFLKSDKTVLFVGTPCQIAGLKTYLGKDYNNLITVDLICHGVPSPVLWQKYIEYREKKAVSKTETVFFRNKKNGWKTFSMHFKFKNGTEYTKVLTEDLYMKGFLSNIFLRDSCYHCKFKGNNYYSDITLADFWGIDKILPDINDNKGVSLMLINTKKGQDLIDKVSYKLHLYPVDKNEALKGNSSYFKSCEYSLIQKLATLDSNRLDFDKLINKYLGQSLPKRILRRICRILAKFFKL